MLKAAIDEAVRALDLPMAERRMKYSFVRYKGTQKYYNLLFNLVFCGEYLGNLQTLSSAAEEETQILGVV